MIQRNTQERTSKKKLSSSLKNASISSITTEVETSQPKNWSTPSKPSVLKTKPNKSWALFNLHHTLKIWTSVLSSKSSDSVETQAVNLPSDNSSSISTSTSKELSALNNSKRSPKASDKTSQLLKLIKWSTMLTKIEMESSTMTNSLTSSPRNTQKSDQCITIDILWFWKQIWISY